MKQFWFRTGKRTKWTLFFLLSPLLLSAQNTTFFLGFTDKDCNASMLSDPTLFLSERAIERRTNQGISITDQDLPVCQDYIDSVASVNEVQVLGVSKWLNGVLILSDDETFNELTTWSIVGSWTSVAKLTSDKVTGESTPVGKPSQTEDLFSQIDMVGGWSMSSAGFLGDGKLIAVMDNGFLGVDDLPHYSHLFDNGQLTDQYNFVNDDTLVFESGTHGAMVLSVMASQEVNGYVGVIPHADYALYVTEADQYERRTEEYFWLLAAERADSLGVDVINTSLGYNQFQNSDFDYEKEDLDGQTAVISRAAEIAGMKGILVVTSAGNEGNVAWETLTVPGDASGVLTVGGVNGIGEYVNFSSIGPTADGRLKPDVATLATGVLVIESDGDLRAVNGTSFATPFVAGLAVAAWQAFPELTAMELLQLIQTSGSQYQIPDNLIGYGVPNFDRLVQRYISERGGGISSSGMFPNPFEQGDLFLSTAGISTDQGVKVEMFNVQGKRVFRQSFNAPGIIEKLNLNESLLAPGVYSYQILVGDDRVAIGVFMKI